jgi:hypothetical protein
MMPCAMRKTRGSGRSMPQQLTQARQTLPCADATLNTPPQRRSRMFISYSAVVQK